MDNSIDNLALDAPILLGLRDKLPSERISTKSSKGFDDLCLTWAKNETVPPLAIVRPQSEAEVAATVAYTNEKSIPLAVRTGGHDGRGRSRPSGALVLDMREIRSVEVVDDGHAAVVGGGILAQDLADALAKTGHTAACGSSGTVGFVGWATHGGYGPFSGSFGLGVDQILGARLVDFEGKVRDADEDLLYGIRGAGSAFGVIISLKIKIYKLEKVLAGALIFSIGPVENDLGQFLQKYQALIDEGLPRELVLGLVVANVPNAGKALLCSVMWASSDIDAGREVVKGIEQKLGPAKMNLVHETTAAEYLRAQDKNGPPYGSAYVAVPPKSMVAPNLNEVRNAMVESTRQLPPNPATLWTENHIHGAALEPTMDSCFPYRDPHFLIEAIGTSITAEAAGISGEWAKAFERDVRALPTTFPGGYVPLSSAEVPPESYYPNHWEKLRALKRAVDPVNRFSYSITGL